MIDNETYLTDRDLAKRYGIHRSTAWQWAKRGQFPRPVRLAPRCARWRLSEVVEWENGRENAA